MSKLKTKADGKKSGKKSDAGKALERSPSHLLHKALQLALDIYAEETGPDAVTQRQYAVLSAVAAREGLTQTDLVHATGIDRSTLADLVARMIGKGLLARERSAADARANIVRLTDDGRLSLAEAEPKVAAADARILKLLPTRKRDAFLDVLHDISRAGDAITSEADAAPKGKKKKKDKGEKAAKSAGDGRVKAAKVKVAKPAKTAKKPEGVKALSKPSSKSKPAKKTTVKTAAAPV